VECPARRANCYVGRSIAMAVACRRNAMPQWRTSRQGLSPTEGALELEALCRVNPVTAKGRIRAEMERRLRAAGSADTKVLIVRAGDFFGPSAAKSWFSIRWCDRPPLTQIGAARSPRHIRLARAHCPSRLKRLSGLVAATSTWWCFGPQYHARPGTRCPSPYKTRAGSSSAWVRA
jgi:hypothetical protein